VCLTVVYVCVCVWEYVAACYVGTYVYTSVAIKMPQGLTRQISELFNLI